MSGRKVFQPATVLTASDVNSFLMNQSVMVFATSASRGSAIPAPNEGMLTYNLASAALELYDGAGWVSITPEDVNPFILIGV